MNSCARRDLDPIHRTVLVPLDATRFADAAIPTARALAARFGATVHTVSVVVSDFERDRIRAQGARALDTDPTDPRIHVEVDSDVAAGVHRCAARLDESLICLSTHARGRVGGTLIGSTARDIIERARRPVVVAGPLVVDPDPDDRSVAAPLGVDRLVACVDGTTGSEAGLRVAAAWAHALGMKLTVVTVAEPCPPPLRIGAPWRRHHGPQEDADEYVRRLAETWALEAPGLDTVVVYDPIGVGPGLRDHLEEHPAGLVAVTSRLRDRVPHLVLGSGAADIVHASNVPVLVIPAPPETT
ncbi:MAG TPA: universal stress protein [Acidimicrobiia bacterium]|nr:universal stress protein [Acidimicrobiia bacterium]